MKIPELPKDFQKWLHNSLLKKPFYENYTTGKIKIPIGLLTEGYYERNLHEGLYRNFIGIEVFDYLKRNFNLTDDNISLNSEVITIYVPCSFIHTYDGNKFLEDLNKALIRCGWVIKRERENKEYRIIEITLKEPHQ